MRPIPYFGRSLCVLAGLVVCGLLLWWIRDSNRLSSHVVPPRDCEEEVGQALVARRVPPPSSHGGEPTDIGAAGVADVGAEEAAVGQFEVLRWEIERKAKSGNSPWGFPRSDVFLALNRDRDLRSALERIAKETFGDASRESALLEEIEHGADLRVRECLVYLLSREDCLEGRDAARAVLLRLMNREVPAGLRDAAVVAMTQHVLFEPRFLDDGFALLSPKLATDASPSEEMLVVLSSELLSRLDEPGAVSALANYLESTDDLVFKRNLSKILRFAPEETRAQLPALGSLEQDYGAEGEYTNFAALLPADKRNLSGVELARYASSVLASASPRQTGKLLSGLLQEALRSEDPNFKYEVYRLVSQFGNSAGVLQAELLMVEGAGLLPKGNGAPALVDTYYRARTDVGRGAALVALAADDESGGSLALDLLRRNGVREDGALRFVAEMMRGSLGE